jgi:hypothetical protein
MEIKPNFTSEPPSEFYLRIHYLCCVLRKINENRDQFVGSFRVRLLPLIDNKDIIHACVIKYPYAMASSISFCWLQCHFFSTQCSYANFSLNYNVHRSNVRSDIQTSEERKQSIPFSAILLKGTLVDNRQNSRRHLSLVGTVSFTNYHMY